MALASPKEHLVLHQHTLKACEVVCLVGSVAAGSRSFASSRACIYKAAKHNHFKFAVQYNAMDFSSEAENII